MKTAVMLALTWTTLAACPKGYEQYENVCEDTRAPDSSPSTPTPTSDEQPSKHPEPAWQRGEVNAATPTSLAGQDAIQDQERNQADSQGKKAADIPQ